MVPPDYRVEPSTGHPQEAKVFIIVLNWNGWRDTLDCLDSLEKLDYPSYEVVVVDNGSTDGSEEKIRERYPRVAVVQTGSNLGFAGGNNAGIEYALQNGASYVWLLNNDTVVDRKSLKELVKQSLSGDSVGIVGSKIRYHDPPGMIWFAGGEVNVLTGRTRHIGIGEMDSGQWDTVRDIAYASGCSMLVNRETIKDIGMMDDRFFMYFEDLDWCVRARRRGWRVRFQPTSLVWHKVSRSSQMRSPGMRFQFSRSSILYARKHGSPSLPALAAQVLLRQVLSGLVRGNPSAAVAAVRGALAGLKK